MAAARGQGHGGLVLSWEWLQGSQQDSRETQHTLRSVRTLDMKTLLLRVALNDVWLKARAGLFSSFWDGRESAEPARVPTLWYRFFALTWFLTWRTVVAEIRRKLHMHFLSLKNAEPFDLTQECVSVSHGPLVYWALGRHCYLIYCG